MRRRLATIGLLLTAALTSQADFLLISPESEIYYGYAVLAGEEIRLQGTGEVAGNLHSNGGLFLAANTLVTGDVSAVGLLQGAGTVDGEVTEGADPLDLPAFPTEEELRDLADRIFEENTTFEDETLDDVVFVDGRVRIRGFLEGVGTLIATGDISMDGAGGGLPPISDESRISLITLGSVDFGPGRVFRGTVLAALDVKLNPGVGFEGVIVAGGTATLLGETVFTFVDFDQEPPQITLVEPEDGEILATASPSVVVEFSDDLSGVDPSTVVLLLDGIDLTAEATITAEGLSFTPAVPLADGLHTLEIAVSDHSANEATGTFTLTTDTVPPALAITAPSDPILYNQATPEIRVEYGDAVAGLDLGTLSIVLDGVDLTPGCTVGAADAMCISPVLAAGSHTVEASIADLAGNAAAASSFFEAVFDEDPPLLAITAPSDPILYNQATPEIRVEYSDAVAGLDLGTLSILLDGVDLTAGCTVGAAEAICISPVLVGGSHTVETSIADLAGNAAAASFTFEAVFDEDPPLLAIAAPSGTVLGDSTPEIVVEYSDAISGLDLATLSIALDGVPILDLCAVGPLAAVCEPPELVDGTYSVDAAITDLAGNTATATSVFEVVLDQQPPALAITAPGAVVINDRTPEIVLEYSDDQSGVDVATLTVSLDGVDLTAACTIAADTATCEPPELVAGTHLVMASLADRAGNSADAQHTFELTIDETPPELLIVSPVSALILEGTMPNLAAVFSDLGSGIDPASLRILLDGIDLTATCAVSGSDAVCPPPVPEPAIGPHEVTVEVSDQLGNAAMASFAFEIFADPTPPVLRLLSPTDPVISGDSTPEIRLEYSDGSTGVNLSTFRVAVDGVDLTATCDVGPAEALCEPPPLGPGLRTLTAQIDDNRGNRATLSFTFEISLVLDIAITSPQQGLLTRASAVEVSGTVSAAAETVSVNGVSATLQSGAFTAQGIPLAEGNNTLTAVAGTTTGGVGSATVNVVRDTSAPLVVIQSPPDGFVTTDSQILVTGEYNDPSSSNVDFAPAAVTVNGVEAAVEQRTFIVEELLLQPGENRIRAQVTDQAGNSRSTEIAVTLLTGVVQKIEELLGNGQSAGVGETLSNPLIVRLRDGIGNPLSNRLVRFEVSRGDGVISSGGETERVIGVRTDQQGLAQVAFTLGDRSGAGNHEVTATSTGFPSSVIFCASAEPASPQRIVRVVGDNATGAMTGVVGTEYSKPLLTQVFDGFGNPVAGVQVTYEVITGDGSFAGAPTLTAASDGQGIASATWTLGDLPGINNNVAVARFAGLQEMPAMYTVSALVPGDPVDTAVSGIVLDNQDDPVPGVTVSLEGTALSTLTDAEGRFRLSGAPVGTVHLVADGATASRPGTWPLLSFELTTISGQDNELGMPIRLLPLATAGARLVGGSQDVVIPMEGVPGASITIFANSATFPDGSRTGMVSLTQVHADKVPMVAPMGSNFALAGTLQPPGVLFDPPAQVKIPNLGDEPGTIIEIFSFDHDLGEFVTAGTATVTEDGQFLVSNPGLGISKSGWHSCVPPPPPKGDACEIGSCTTCGSNGPEPRCSECERCSGSSGCMPRTLDDVTATARGAGDSGSQPAVAVGSAVVTAPQTAPGDDMELVVGVDQEVILEAKDLQGNCPASQVVYRWNFGDGQQGEGKSTTHTYERVGTFEAEVRAECEGCSGAGSPSDTVTIRVIKLDMRIHNLPEEDESPPNEEDPGGFVPLNNDDDDENGQVDFMDSTAFGDDDLITLRLDVENNLPEGEVRLEVTAGEGKIKIWDDRGKFMRIDVPKTWRQPDETVPGVVFIEGIENSDSPGDVEIELIYENDREGMAKDLVKISVVEVDLDVDSDNNDGFSPPGRTTQEDRDEDIENDPFRPGKYILVNDNDDDQDTVTDFADGFNRDAGLAEDDVNADEMFVQIVLTLPEAVDLNEAKIRLTYGSSDPSGVTQVDVAQQPATITVPDYRKGGGHLRIWKSPGQSSRNAMNIKAGGDFIPPDTYIASDLGMGGGNREKTFYLEAISRSARLADQRILIEVDPDGDSGPMGFILKDAVRLSLLALEVRDAGDGNRLIEGGDMAFIQAASPTMPQLSAVVLPAVQDQASISCRMKITFDRSPGDNVGGVPDEVNLPEGGTTGRELLSPGQAWNIAAAYTALPAEDQFFGGDGYVECDGSSFLEKHQFRIRGRNPEDVQTRNFIDLFFPDFLHFGYAVSKHESTIPGGGFPDERYHQFDLRVSNGVRRDNLFTPITGTPDGWGLYQNDLSAERNAGNIVWLTKRELWNWRSNVIRGADILNAKVAIGNTWLNEAGRVRFVGGACLLDGGGNPLPHGQRPQSGIAGHGGVWQAIIPPGGACDSATLGAWVGAAPMFEPIADTPVADCTFSENLARGTTVTSRVVGSFEDAVGLKCFNGCARHWVGWGAGVWDFDPFSTVVVGGVPRMINYVEEVCGEVEP